MSDSNIELPQEWTDQGWTIETAGQEREPQDEAWNAEVVVAAADPSTLPAEGSEGDTAYG
jgi:hypothetical protein